MQQKKMIVLVGPTASGKSDLTVRLARKYNGEVISADSRQVYRGLNIGSGKITENEMMGIPHHLLDVVFPKRKFTVAQYQKLALRAIRQIHKKGKLPFLAGGSPFYVYSVADRTQIPEVKPNPKLRAQLERLSIDELYQKLQRLDPQRAKTIEQKNPRRLIRALEIVLTTKKPVPSLRKKPLSRLRQGFDEQAYPVLFIGIKKSPRELKKLIAARLEKRLRKGMIKEVARLHQSGVSWKRLEELGLEYRFIAQYLQGKISRQEMINSIQKESERFARRQMTWFKRDPRTHWISTFKEANKLVKDFVK